MLPSRTPQTESALNATFAPHAPTLLLALTTLTGCFPWGSRAQHRLPTETAFDRSYTSDQRMIIIGAGAAGLAAARIFEDNGVEYTLVEATDRYGGRLQASTEFADFPIDLGAEWIHNQPQILDVLSGIDGTAANTPLIPYHVDEAATWDGTTLHDATDKADWMFNFFPEYKFKDSTWYDFADAHYGQRVAHRIRYASPVTAIDYAGSEVRVTLRDGEVLAADQVLVTVSIGVLRAGAIDFNPDLSAKKQAAIGAVDFPTGLKVFLKFNSDFYPDLLEYEVADGQMGFWDAAFGKDTDDHVLGALILGEAAARFSAMPSEEAMVTALLADLDQMFDGQASKAYSGDHLVVDWGNAPYVRGTWVEGFRVKKRTVKALNEPLDGRVFFAGEACDEYHQMGVPGAMLSGIQTAGRMLEADGG